MTAANTTGIDESWAHTFLQLTDMHIDPLFHSDAPIAAKCHYHLNEKRAKSSRVYGQADSGCDSPPLLIQHTFAALRDSFSGIAVINRTASLQHYRLLGQQPPLAFVLWTGDNSRHDRDENLRKQRIEVYEHNVFVVQHFLDAFDTTTIPVIPTIGNWDVFPVSQLACRPPLVDPGAPNMAEFSALSLDDPPVYDPALVSLWSLWEPLFPNPNDPEGLEAKRTFLKFGFFSRSVLSGTTEVLSLNTLSFFNENALVLDCAQFKLLAGQKREWDLEHPGDAQLAWMEDRFLAARIDSRKIILQGHVGPNGNNEQLWKDNCFEWGVYFSGEYSDVIIGQYYGHINRDLVHVISQRHPRNKPNAYKVGRNSTLMSTIAPIVVNPFRLTTMVPNIIKSFDVKSWGVVSAIHTSSSIVPAYNPGFRVGIIEITPHESPQGRSRPHNRENLHANFLHVEITEHETRFLDISAANKAATEAMDSQQPLPPLVYKSSCNSRLDHEMEDLSPSSFQKWIATMQGAFPDLNKKTGDGAKLLRRYTKCIETSYGVMSNEFGDPIKIVDIRGAFGSFVTLLVFLYLSIWIRKRKKQVWTVMEVGVEGSDVRQTAIGNGTGSKAANAESAAALESIQSEKGVKVTKLRARNNDSKGLRKGNDSTQTLASTSSLPSTDPSNFPKGRRNAMKPLAGATAASQPSKTAKANSSSLRNSTAILSNTSNAIKPRRSTVKGIPASLLRPTSASLAKQREKAVVSSEEMNLASSQDFVNPSSGYPSTEQLHSLNSDDEREEYYSQEQDNRKQDQYPPTAHQLSLYNILCPDIEESEIQKPSRCTNYSHYITQSFKFSNGAIKHELLCRTVNKIVNSYKILTTKFYKNEKILDADVEAFIDFKNSAASYPPDKFTATHETTSALTTEYVSQFLQSWILSRKEGSLEPVFQAFIVTSAQMSKSYVAIAISTSVIDEVSSIMITNEIFSLYFEALQRDSILTAHRVIDSYTSKEQNDDFTDFAYKISAASRNATNVWKDVCIETVQENIEGPERVDIENQRKHLMVECDSLRAQVSNLTIRKAELEIELSTLRYQRRQMDVDNVGPMEVYLDPVTNQVTEVSKAAKAAISRLVLGDDAVGDNVGALLSKHDCSDDILYKMKNMRLDEFSRISEDDLVLMGLMAKDRRKVMALSEYVRNRVKESMQEQTKIKFALERKILKQQREYDMVASNLKAAQNSLDISDDMAIRLGNVLNPPAFDVKIHALGLEKNRARPTWPSDYHEVWGFLPFEIDELVVKTLRAFKESCKNSERQKKKTRSRSAPDHDSDNYATSSEDEHDPFSDIKPQNSKACCLAAFAVMLKHVAGCEKFLIGCVESFRKNGVLVGPLTDIVPVKFDFTGNETTFNSVLNAVKKSLWNVNRLVSESPFIDTAKKLEVDSVFPIQFQYFPEKETLSWRHAGMTTRDLLSMKVFSAHESKPEHNIVDIERQWVINELSRDCEFKLTLVEDADEIVGAIQYRKDLYDDDKVQKWVAKFITTLEGLEYSPKKISISNLISRYYSSVLLHGNGEDGIDKHASRRSMASINTLAGSESSGLFNM